MLSLGWFSTGRDKAARDLLETTYRAIKEGKIDATICFVFCSREPGESPESDAFIRLVKAFNLPLVCLSYRSFKSKYGTGALPQGALPSWRQEYDRQIMQEISVFSPELCFLAGYMLVVGEELCSRYDMLNLHPSLPGGPTGTWEEVIWQLIETRATQAGAMIHLVTPELDKGPAVSQCKFSLQTMPFNKYWKGLSTVTGWKIREDPQAIKLFRLIRAFELAREFPLVVETLKSISSGLIGIDKVRLESGRASVTACLDLSQEVESAIPARYRSSSAKE